MEVVVLEDDESSRFLFKRLLEGAGYRVHEADTVSSAIEIAKQRIPHAVLVDLILNHESGLDYINEHRSEGSLKNVPILITTGLFENSNIAAPVGIMSLQVIAKPIYPPELIKALKRAIHDSKMVPPVMLKKDSSIVKLTGKGKITSISESGCVVEMPIRMNEGERVKLTSALMKEVGWENAVFVKSKSLASPSVKGQYSNDLVAAGPKSESVALLRNKIRGWK